MRLNGFVIGRTLFGFFLFSTGKSNAQSCTMNIAPFNSETAVPWKAAVSVLDITKGEWNSYRGIHISKNLVLIADKNYFMDLKTLSFKPEHYSISIANEQPVVVTHVRNHPNYTHPEQEIINTFALIHIRDPTRPGVLPCLPTGQDSSGGNISVSGQIFNGGVPQTVPFFWTPLEAKMPADCGAIWENTKAESRGQIKNRSLDGCYCSVVNKSTIKDSDKLREYDPGVFEEIDGSYYLTGIVVNPSPIISPIELLLYEKFGQEAVNWIRNNEICSQNGTFTCSNGTCIDLWKVCDGFDHCEDKSDEAMPYCNTLCPTNNKTKESPCGLERCLPSEDFDIPCQPIVPGQKRAILLTRILIGGGTSFAMIVTAGLLLHKMRTKKLKDEIRNLTPQEEKDFLHGVKVSEVKADGSYIRQILDSIQSRPWDMKKEIPRSMIEIGPEISRGHYGIVSKARLIEKNGRNVLWDVAVKTAIPSIRVSEFKALLDEVKIMSCIGSHQHVVGFLGACTQSIRRREVFLVMEFCGNGSLLEFLISNRPRFDIPSVDIVVRHYTPAVSTVPLEKSYGASTLLSWAVQASSGLEFLASNRVLHRDIAARNLLLSNHMRIKIADFGLSRKLEKGSVVYAHVSGDVPWRWLAPEAFQLPPSYSEKSDMWAFGITLWEMFSLGETPYDALPWFSTFPEELVQGLRPGMPLYSSSEMYRIMQMCWSLETVDRPTFTIIKELLIQELENNVQNIGESTPAYGLDEYVEVMD